MAIFEYLVKEMSVKDALSRVTDTMGCSPYGKSQPSAAEKAKARKSFVNRARALLKFLGVDPTPANVSKVKASEADPRVLTVNNREFLIMDNEETLAELELRILTYPKRLPAKFLGLFLTGAFIREVPYNVITVVAEALRRDQSLESNWALHQLIDFDKFAKNHIQEIIDHAGIETLFYGSKVGQVEFNGNNYVIVEQAIRGPKTAITENYDEMDDCVDPVMQKMLEGE